MKNFITKIILCVGLLLIASCDKYLDVTPEDQLLETDVFNNETGTQNALNGIYSSMTSASLYGGNLTFSTIEVLGQRFDISDSQHDFKNTSLYEYQESSAKGRFNAVWAKMYKTILEVNNFIKGVEEFPNVLSDNKKDLLEGEAFALRAFMHFDLLRTFGPVYVNNSSAESIPYSLKPKASITSILPANEVMEKILADLDSAETLLENDPVREYGKISVLEEDSKDLNPTNPLTDYKGTDFYRFRGLRMNYYAVKALQARVNLYAGNTEAAKAAALAVINEAGEPGKNWFPWVNELDVIAAGDSPDRVLSSEVIFGLQNRSLYTRNKSFYAPSLNDKSILTTKGSRLNEVYENNPNDIRFQSSWAVPSNGSKPYKTLIKFDDVADNSKDFRFLQPLIRMSEMYYIAAETTGNFDYLNKVREHRNLAPTSGDIQAEILKEYEKEFYGEGQLFFYYKRLDFPTIKSGSSSNATIDMGPSQYVVPLPESEIDFR